jgi:hypothetical protein
MKTIKINGNALRVTAAEQRCLETLVRQDYAALKGDFVEGSGNYQRSTLPKERDRRDALGITEQRHASPRPKSWKRRARFFKKHPRAYSGIFGNPRRINAILRKL